MNTKTILTFTNGVVYHTEIVHIYSTEHFLLLHLSPLQKTYGVLPCVCSAFVFRTIHTAWSNPPTVSAMHSKYLSRSLRPQSLSLSTMVRRHGRSLGVLDVDGWK